MFCIINQPSVHNKGNTCSLLVCGLYHNVTGTLSQASKPIRFLSALKYCRHTVGLKGIVTQELAWILRKINQRRSLLQTNNYASPLNGFSSLLWICGVGEELQVQRLDIWEDWIHLLFQLEEQATCISLCQYKVGLFLLRKGEKKPKETSLVCYPRAQVFSEGGRWGCPWHVSKLVIVPVMICSDTHARGIKHQFPTGMLFAKMLFN